MTRGFQMPFPLKRVVLVDECAPVVAGPSIMAAHAATREGHTSVKTSGPDNGTDNTPDHEHDTRSASLWFSRAIDAHPGSAPAATVATTTAGEVRRRITRA